MKYKEHNRKGGWFFLAGFVLVTCCSCTTPTTEPVATAITIDNLPCAEIEKDPTLMIRYPSASLYHAGAVLPTRQGLACLEALASWLSTVPPDRWQLTVGAETAADFEPLLLATKRQELLTRFFARKGIQMQEWQWLATAEPAAQLRLQLTKDSP